MLLSRRPVCLALIGGLALPGLLKVYPAMSNTPLDPTEVSYAQANLVEKPARFLFVSGQVPADASGTVPVDFESQCRLTWRNVERQLFAGGMTLANLVKVTVFLSDRKYRAANSRIRHEILGEISPALTIIIAGIYEEEWLLEIEAIAAG